MLNILVARPNWKLEIWLVDELILLPLHWERGTCPVEHPVRANKEHRYTKCPQFGGAPRDLWSSRGITRLEFRGVGKI